jgi:hypothetical protein
LIITFWAYIIFSFIIFINKYKTSSVIH